MENIDHRNNIDMQAEIFKALDNVIGKAKKPVQLHEPFFNGREEEYAADCVRSGWVSYSGKYVENFEKMLSDFTGAKFAIATVNGTCALHLCLIVAGVKEGDEVIVPDLTFVATANAVRHCGAFANFADIDPTTLSISPSKLLAYLVEIGDIRHGECFNRKTGRRIKALVVMHTFGHCADMDPIIEICEKYKIELVEDAAQSLGSFYRGRHTGNFGKTASLSFNGNKTITTGGGGALLTNDPAIANLAKHISTTAKEAHPFEFFHDMTGYNYRMPNVNAAIGCAQMENIGGFVARKRLLAEKYAKEFAGIKGVRFFAEPDYCKSNYWLNTIIIDGNASGFRDDLILSLRKGGYMVRPAWQLMHTLPMLQDCTRMDLRVSKDLQNRIINLPSSVFLTE